MDKIAKTIFEIKKTKPLILNLTNFVTMDFVANCLLAIGAAPIMCVYEEELEELIKLSAVIYINIGTLNDEFIHLATKAQIISSKYNKPIILDPVGAGATKIRTEISKKIAATAKIIRGNASEIMALNNESFASKGVEAVHSTDAVTDIADNLAKHLKNTIVVSGAIDYITNGTKKAQLAFGSPIMQNVTGMGCALTATLAAFLAVAEDPYDAGIIGSKYFSLCGQITSQNHKNPGSFKASFIDELYNPNIELMRKISEN